MKNIKKYENRKLYNTETSKYITLKDIKSYLSKGEQVEVLEHKTNKNVTREVLLETAFRYSNLSLDTAVKLVMSSTI